MKFRALVNCKMRAEPFRYRTNGSTSLFTFPYRTFSQQLQIVEALMTLTALPCTSSSAQGFLHHCGAQLPSLVASFAVPSPVNPGSPHKTRHDHMAAHKELRKEPIKNRMKTCGLYWHSRLLAYYLRSNGL